MRRRYDFPDGKDIENDDGNGEQTVKNKINIHGIPFYAVIIFLIFIWGLNGIVYIVDNILPTPLNVSDEATYPHAFIASRAHSDLKLLTDLGPRIVGSYENEVLAVDILTRQINAIQQEANKNQLIELDIQQVSGSHYLDYRLGGKIIAYSNLKNIVVKLHSINNANESVLINAHFDSVPTSPGGSDDGINVAAMLEILRKLSKKTERPLNNIIFLFNGAEETGLQAAHGFITKHKWAKECKVVVNLEATGAGGKIILFQAGPGASWLMKYYNDVPHPYGQAAGEEIFQSGQLPSDTDYRIFRDYGDLVGFDMAFFKQGYRYHTKYDDLDHIPLGSFQHVGDNTLSLITSLGNAPEVRSPKTSADKIVYFDFLGLFMVNYTATTGRIINFVTVLLSVVIFLVALYDFKLGISKQTAIYLTLTLFAILGSWILAGLVIFLLSTIIDKIGYCMSWYRNTWLIYGLYVIPTISSAGFFILFVKHQNSTHNIKAQIHAHITRLIWTIILLIGSILNIRTMYALMIPVLFNCLGFVIIYIFKLQRTVRAWQVVYVIFNVIPTIPLLYNALTTVQLFIPMTGRIGPDKNADLIIGFISMFFTILILSYFVALINLVRNIRWLYAVFGAIYLVSFIIIFTPVGFPYSGDVDTPTPERYWIIHTGRTLRSENGEEKRDSGYFLLNMDRNSPNILKPYVKELSRARSVKDECNKYLLCGLPLAHSKMVLIMQYSTWIPAGKPELPVPISLKVLSKINLTPTQLRYNISISGPDRIGLYMSPVRGFNITNISLIKKVPPLDETPKLNGRPVYFMLHIFGGTAAPFQFTFDVEVPEKFEENITAELAFSGIYVHNSLNRPLPHYVNFLNQFPDWADVTPWLGTYENVWI